MANLNDCAVHLFFRPCITSQQYILTMWATAFYIMENYHVELRDLEFPSQILQVKFVFKIEHDVCLSVCLVLSCLSNW